MAFGEQEGTGVNSPWHEKPSVAAGLCPALVFGIASVHISQFLLNTLWCSLCLPVLLCSPCLASQFDCMEVREVVHPAH